MSQEIYKNEDLSFRQRVEDLVSRMTDSEKISQLMHASPEIERLGIDAYNWWNEALHGVARAGVATMFPQAIGMAATFDEDMLFKVGDIISTEGRAKYHEFVRKNDRDIYKGLTFWSPNINIFRDPRWGRGHETYGEDPYLTARLAIAFIKGIQGNDEKYLKAAACAKHYAVHSGPEGERHEFNAVVSEKDLRETYLYAFKQCVTEGRVAGVMGAYNAVNGEPCCGSKTLLKDILRGEWGFEGYVVSDCWAIQDFNQGHKVTDCIEESAALALKNGCDINCGFAFSHLLRALNDGVVTEEEINRAVTNLLMIRMRLGMFDSPEKVPFASIPYEMNDCREHNEFSMRVAKSSIVLLKNKDKLLPLDKTKIKSLAVIGPNADSRQALVGNYFGTASEYVTVLQGIREYVGDDVRIYYAEGCHLFREKCSGLSRSNDRLSEALSAAERADVTILCLGLDGTLEGEQGDASNTDASGDKINLDLPGYQQHLLEAVCATGKPVVLVLMSGSALSVTWADEHVPAILQAWYPGSQGGRAVASVLFGEDSPCGRLPITFYRTTDELPDFRDYSMENRTYRFMENEPLYPFGYGLSYTSFEYSDLKLNSHTISAGEDIKVSVTVKNTGTREANEIVQIYLKDLESEVRLPNRQLVGIKKVFLRPGEKETVCFEVSPRQMAVIRNDGSCVLEPGDFMIYAGGSQPDSRSVELTGAPCLSAKFTVTGKEMNLEY
ncbi:MAG: glycoside hydrolase family 3 protein [Clostridiales bacterium]|jgi:beta-glucosidase|nr:glycoside hydrolase family 3 protein [Clostridiales bacterium]